jgi:hypothetical protein
MMITGRAYIWSEDGGQAKCVRIGDGPHAFHADIVSYDESDDPQHPDFDALFQDGAGYEITIRRVDG